MLISKHTHKKWPFIYLALILLLVLASLFVYHAVYQSGFTQTEDSFFTSSLLTNKTVLVLVPHPDDEPNLAFGIIDAFVQAGSRVVVAIATNGDAYTTSDIRVEETIEADTLMGVQKDNIVLLGYGDHLVPPYFFLDADLIRESDAGYTQTYGGAGILDYHSLCFDKPADYTCRNFEDDIRHLIETLKPDIIITSDTDYHIDHVSLSQSFDTVMGELLRDNPTYHPMIYKGFCYDYAWFANDDFYNYLTLQSAVSQWNAAAYNTAYPWEERIRFPLPSQYLGYTLHSSKLRKVLLSYDSQHAVSREGRLLNSDKLLWERRSDILWADVTATSGDASLLQDFLISDTMEVPLANCWIPDAEDINPQIKFTWPVPQAIAQIVFYDAPPEAGDIRQVRITDDTGYSVDYSFPSGSGAPCHLDWNPDHTVQCLSIEVLESEGSIIGFSEIEILPKRDRQTAWIHLTDTDDNFLYEYACPSDEPFSLPLYGYPSTPAQATAVIIKEGSSETIAEIPYDGHAFHIPGLSKGNYHIYVDADNCTVEAVLRAGDPMLKERIYRFIERKLSGILPN